MFVLRIVVLAGDTLPIDVYCHVPVMCEDRNLPYAFIPSKMVSLSLNFLLVLVLIGAEMSGKSSPGCCIFLVFLTLILKCSAGPGLVCRLQAAHLCDPDQISPGLPGRVRRVSAGSVQPAQTALNQSGSGAH